VCEQFGDFIARTLEERMRNGSLTVLGKVGECDPPYLILPLTVEPTKPRLCHDERFLNLLIVDSPFSLEKMGQKVKFCTMIVPFEDVKPAWWPVLCRVMVDHMVIGKKGDLNVLLIPSKNGFRQGKYGLEHDMWAAKLYFQ